MCAAGLGRRGRNRQLLLGSGDALGAGSWHEEVGLCVIACHLQCVYLGRELLGCGRGNRVQRTAIDALTKLQVPRLMPVEMPGEDSVSAVQVKG